jgi:hypothetical protein
MIPSVFLKVDAFPLTPNGKVNRRALPEPRGDLISAPATGSFSAPSTKEETLLAGIWSQVLGLERVGIHDDIFELGGDSIYIFQITTRANREGLQLSPALIFQHRTIAEILRRTQSRPAGEIPQPPVPSIQRVNRDDYRRKS